MVKHVSYRKRCEYYYYVADRATQNNLGSLRNISLNAWKYIFSSVMRSFIEGKVLILGQISKIVIQEDLNYLMRFLSSRKSCFECLVCLYVCVSGCYRHKSKEITASESQNMIFQISVIQRYYLECLDCIKYSEYNMYF